MVSNFLTFDIEEWYHANYEGMKLTKAELHKKTHLEALVDTFLEICDRHRVKATFFVVASLAQKYPALVKRIAKHGHEIASHSVNHELVYNMTPEQFRKDAEQSKRILERISGTTISGYRAPSWSVNTETLSWYYKTLKRAGYHYSSSVFPAKTFLYGIDGARPEPHWIDKTHKFYEVPCSTTKVLGRMIGFSGGVYLRLLPSSFISGFIIRNTQKQIPTIFYLHPREIDPDQPRLRLPPLISFIHYYGVNNCKNKLEQLVDNNALTLKKTLRQIQIKQD